MDLQTPKFIFRQGTIAIRARPLAKCNQRKVRLNDYQVEQLFAYVSIGKSCSFWASSEKKIEVLFLPTKFLYWMEIMLGQMYGLAIVPLAESQPEHFYSI